MRRRQTFIHVALPVLRHRIIPTFNAESDGFDADDLDSANCWRQ